MSITNSKGCCRHCSPFPGCGLRRSTGPIPILFCIYSSFRITICKYVCLLRHIAATPSKLISARDSLSTFFSYYVTHSVGLVGCRSIRLRQRHFGLCLLTTAYRKRQWTERFRTNLYLRIGLAMPETPIKSWILFATSTVAPLLAIRKKAGLRHFHILSEAWSSSSVQSKNTVLYSRNMCQKVIYNPENTDNLGVGLKFNVTTV